MRRSIEIFCPVPPLSKLTSEFAQVAFLNSNHLSERKLLAWGELSGFTHIHRSGKNTGGLRQLQNYLNQANDWVFGYFSFDLKNETSPRQNSRNVDRMEFPLMRFFQPKWVVEWQNDHATLYYHDQYSNPDELSETIELLAATQTETESIANIASDFIPAVHRSDYLSQVINLQKHIQLGNIYEVNYCIPFETKVPELDCAALYHRLNNLTEAPFSVYFSDLNHALMCGSPERFLKKTGRKITTQPIKGTIRRGAEGEDKSMINQLKNDPKERAENVMITDLVRNDLSRIAAPETVQVDELCGVYSFKTVHQLISTVSATLAEGKTLSDIIEATFPMGSMTGAPKIRALQLIEEAEVRQRGLYSGSFGYFDPHGDFDFNVVIRSLMYNRENQCLSFQVGSAITALSDPQKEYEECLLKAEALLRAAQMTSHAV